MLLTKENRESKIRKAFLDLRKYSSNHSDSDFKTAKHNFLEIVNSLLGRRKKDFLLKLCPDIHTDEHLIAYVTKNTNSSIKLFLEFINNKNNCSSNGYYSSNGNQTAGLKS